jgi:hypothetical protein
LFFILSPVSIHYSFWLEIRELRIKNMADTSKKQFKPLNKGQQKMVKKKPSTPKDTVPADTVPKDTIPKDTAIKDATPKATPPKTTAPKSPQKAQQASSPINKWRLRIGGNANTP